ncbi:MAG: hypothetical protein PHZ02_02690 [Desulfocapsaceae bacterium]|nr:hypothetical protein [Desulfocapsaceae bacterium]
MKLKLSVIAMMAVLMLWGCTPDEKKAEAPVSETMPTTEQQAMDKAVGETEAAKEKLEETTQEAAEAVNAADAVVEKAITGEEEKVAEAAAAVSDAAKEVVEAVEKKIEINAEQQTAVAVQEEKVKVAEKMEQQAASAVEVSGQAVTTKVESIVIENKNGKVLLSHKKHAEAYGCAACHGDQKPGPFMLGKDKAHALCQGCHKEKKAGPTSCSKCHQKKAKAIEGC